MEADDIELGILIGTGPSIGHGEQQPAVLISSLLRLTCHARGLRLPRRRTIVSEARVPY